VELLLQPVQNKRQEAVSKVDFGFNAKPLSPIPLSKEERGIKITFYHLILVLTCSNIHYFQLKLNTKIFVG